MRLSQDNVLTIACTAIALLVIVMVGKGVHNDTLVNRELNLKVKERQDLILEVLQHDQEQARTHRLLILRILRKMEALTPEEAKALEIPELEFKK